MKAKVSFVCQQCGYESPSWYGRCPNCETWNSLVETVRESPGRASFLPSNTREKLSPQLLSEIRHIEKNRLKSGYEEFDRVMGGGIVPGSVTLLAGDPGIGKSTLLLVILAKIGGLYVSGEESAEQVKLRSKRLGIDGKNTMILTDTNVESIVGAINPASQAAAGSAAGSGKNSGLNPFRLVIVDSIQTLYSDELSGLAGSVGQIRHSTELLIAQAKHSGIPVIIIGHVTKEGMIAGPKILEHMVDTVLYLEGERLANARILRTLKNRYGAIEEVGIFEMNDSGIAEIANPSSLFLKDRLTGVAGSVVTVLLEGTRPILTEIQALTVPSPLAIPRRVANGFDFNRLQLLVAILQKRLNLPLGTFDIFINVSGGLKITEPAADLAAACAIISSIKNKPFNPNAAVFGEVGLLGEVRSVGYLDRRIAEAKRLGFGSQITVKNAPDIAAAASFLR